ncbi:unnamed protein product [Cladocopium goreaui]|uniref:Uncharacterized protein n=2 Tax=Cladocopium goreaui TaxID=2562237 RepID=A0A9P1GES3_9DINO|nr:unnamed protein product [Cladocopium goreaui]
MESLSSRPPAVSLGVPTVLPGLDEILYREAEERKHRQEMREREALIHLREQSIPRLGRRSKAYYGARLERELLAAFDQCPERNFIALNDQKEVLAIPRSKVGDVLELMGFVKDNSFCSRLGVLLDREESGMICFDRLLHFISNALDTERTPPRFLAFSLEEECFNQLEWQLSKDFGRMLYNKHNKSTTESIARRFERAADPEPPRPPSPPPRPTTPRCPAARAGKGAQLEKEIKELNLQQEMQECTFHPQLIASTPQRRAASPHVRNFEATVMRMKQAQKQHQRRLKEQNRIPAGEKYEKLRRLGPQPFSCAFRRRSKPKPLVYVDVKVGSGRTGRVGVHEGDDFRVLARQPAVKGENRNFAKTFQLDRDARPIRTLSLGEPGFGTLSKGCLRLARLADAETGKVAAKLSPEPGRPQKFIVDGDKASQLRHVATAAMADVQRTQE